ncbi:MAG: glycosyltransferase [Bacteroidota bacterium]
MNKKSTHQELEKTLDTLMASRKNAGNAQRKDTINLCFVNTTKTWGGGERWHFENAIFARDHGFNVGIVCTKESSLAKQAAKAGINCYYINLSGLSFLNPFKLQKLWQYFKINGIDAVVFNGSADLKTAGIASRRAGVPLRIYRRGLAKAPHPGFLNHFLFNHVVTDFIVNSKATAEQLFSNISFKKKESRVHLLYNGLHPHDDRKKMDVNPGKVVFGNASRFVEQKGLHFLLEMAAIIKASREDFILRIAGKGPLETELKHKVADLKLDDYVEFSGFVEDIRSFMHELDIYVCTSLYEGFGFSIAEAMHAGKAVIGFDVSSNPELILDEKNGYLVPLADVNTLAEKAMLLMENDEKRLKMGIEGKKMAMKKFNKDIQHQSFCELIKDLVQKRS